ncbi:hypothetical protein ACI2L1_10770 [Streptomyces sp. NPDC019531]|uniref:hypothetical protein n=1 Tax=Streptomyces sp. NPDC019531 TaxID=3365062 RepID=UPI00384C9120
MSVTNGGSAFNSLSPGGGYGLIGMRERVRSTGGRIRAGHRPQGGYQVVVELPYHPQEAAV